MEKTTNTIYYSRTETEQDIVVVWKPFSTYSTFVLLALLLLGSWLDMTLLPLGAYFLLFVNAIVYFLSCKKPRSEIKEASRNSSVKVSGNKFSFSSPLTVTISKEHKSSDEIPNIPKRGGKIRKIIFGFLTGLFSFLGFFVFTAFTDGVRRGIYYLSSVILLVMALIFFLLAYLCLRAFKK